jgi:hypothetical protein
MRNPNRPSKTRFSKRSPTREFSGKAEFSAAGRFRQSGILSGAWRPWPVLLSVVPLFLVLAALFEVLYIAIGPAMRLSLR